MEWEKREKNMAYFSWGKNWSHLSCSYPPYAYLTFIIQLHPPFLSGPNRASPSVLLSSPSPNFLLPHFPNGRVNTVAHTNREMDLTFKLAIQCDYISCKLLPSDLFISWPRPELLLSRDHGSSIIKGRHRRLLVAEPLLPRPPSSLISRARALGDDRQDASGVPQHIAVHPRDRVRMMRVPSAAGHLMMRPNTLIISVYWLFASTTSGTQMSGRSSSSTTSFTRKGTPAPTRSCCTWTEARAALVWTVSFTKSVSHPNPYLSQFKPRDFFLSLFFFPSLFRIFLLIFLIWFSSNYA